MIKNNYYLISYIKAPKYFGAFFIFGLMRKTLNLFLLIISILLTACNAFYVPVLINAPMFEEKNEIVINSSYGINGYNFQGAYSFTDKFAFIANSRFYSNSTKGYEGYVINQSKQIELGIGRYGYKINDLRFEIFTGFGSEYNLLYTGRYQPNEKSIYYKANYFLQPNIGIVTNFAETTFSLKINNLHYIKDDLSNMKNIKYDCIIEPAITTSIGYKYVKFFCQGGITQPLYIGRYYYSIIRELTKEPQYTGFYPFQYLNLSLGINVKIAHSFKTKKAPK